MLGSKIQAVLGSLSFIFKQRRFHVDYQFLYIEGKQQEKNKTKHFFFLNSYRTLVKSFPNARFCKVYILQIS